MNNQNDFAITGMRQAGFIQHVGIASGEITDHHAALYDRRKYIIHNLCGPVNLINTKCFNKKQLITSCLDRFIDHIESFFEGHHHSNMIHNWQGPLFDTKESRNTFPRRPFEYAKKPFEYVTLFNGPVRAKIFSPPSIDVEISTAENFLGTEMSVQVVKTEMNITP